LLWDELYGLLEPAQSEALLEHLAGCTECEAELAKARAEQKLVAEAARLDIIVPPFTAPADDSQAAIVEIASGARSAKRWLASWPWLAAAAAVLLAIWLPYGIFRSGLAQRETRLLSAQGQAEVFVVAREKLREKSERDERAIRDKHIQLQVFGPVDVDLRAAA